MDINKEALERIRVAVPKFRPPSASEKLSAVLNPAATSTSGSFDVATERRMMDSILGRPNSTKPSPSGSQGSSGALDGKAGSSQPSSTLVSTLASRLQQLEVAQAQLRNELVAKDRELMSSRRQLESAVQEARVLREATAAAVLSEGGSEGTKATPRSVAEGQDRALAGHRELSASRDALLAQNERLRQENKRLSRRVGAMESFLSDYGLVWVGDGTEDGQVSEAEDEFAGGNAKTTVADIDAEESNSEESDSVYPTVDFTLLKLRLSQLNKLAGEGKAVVVEKNGAHVLEQPTGLPLTIYADGIMIGRGPFRAYTSASTQAFITDVCDGYFPFAFKDSYPKGVIFDVKDRAGEAFKAAGGTPSQEGRTTPTAGAGGFVAFSGEGRAIGASHRSSGRPPAGPPSALEGQPMPAATRPASRMDGRVANLATLGGGQIDLSAPISSEQLLAALPRTTVAGGQLVDVRGVVSGALGKPDPSATTVPSAVSPMDRVPPGVLLADTPVIRALRARATDSALHSEHASSGAGAVAAPDMSTVATVQVKLDMTVGAGAVRVLLVKLFADDTIGSLRYHVDQARPAGAPAYELRTAVPPRAYGDMQQTLRQAGLVPNATLIVRPVVAA